FLPVRSRSRRMELPVPPCGLRAGLADPGTRSDRLRQERQAEARGGPHLGVACAGAARMARQPAGAAAHPRSERVGVGTGFDAARMRPRAILRATRGPRRRRIGNAGMARALSRPWLRSSLARAGAAAGTGLRPDAVAGCPAGRGGDGILRPVKKRIYIYSPSSAVRDKAAFRRGVKRLKAL